MGIGSQGTDRSRGNLLLHVFTLYWMLSRAVVCGWTVPLASAFRPSKITHPLMPRITRQSARLLTIAASSKEEPTPSEPAAKGSRKRTATVPTKKRTTNKKGTTPASTSETATSDTTPSSSDTSSIKTNDTDRYCLPRTRELAILKKDSYRHVIGIDEAGRGPLAGPVVAAAVYAPQDIVGIVDSKRIVKEEERESLYEEIMASEQILWAVAVVSAGRIDEVNILQATLEAMTMAATALVMDSPNSVMKQASIEHAGCYVVRRQSLSVNKNAILPIHSTYALIDGNQLPPAMPVAAETMVKGDSKEYCIAAASVLAKVTRDRLMYAYADLYPEYNFRQHKGYPTKGHKEAIVKHGATAIHRRTFAPLKHMDLGPK